jgi:hypothetical protein
VGFGRWVHLDVEEIRRETDRAFLLVLDGEEVWVPKSQVSDPEDYAEGDRDVSLSVTDFIAHEKGLA